MKPGWLAVMAAALALGAPARPGAAQEPVVEVEFSNPAMNPAHWLLTLHPDGSGHFQSEMRKAPRNGQQEINAPGVDRDLRVSARFARRVFDVAQRHNRFNQACDSHLKVAFQGWKSFRYIGAGGSGSCTFNYSKDKEMQELGDSMVAVAATLTEGARLETLLQHDPLGLDREMDFLVQAAGDGRAQQLCTIRPIIERLAQDDGVLERVRKRARLLLAKADASV